MKKFAFLPFFYLLVTTAPNGSVSTVAVVPQPNTLAVCEQAVKEINTLGLRSDGYEISAVGCFNGNPK